MGSGEYFSPTSVADLDPHHFGKLDPHSHQSEKPGAVKAHGVTMEAHPGDVEAHNGA